MIKFAAILILTVAGWALAAEPSVWEQQESGTVDSIDAKIERVNHDGLTVTYVDKETDSTQTVKICDQDRAVQGDFYTEADRALALNRRVRMFERAAGHKGTLKIALRGPWNPCVYPAD